MYNAIINIGLVLAGIGFIFPIIVLVVTPNLFENGMVLMMLISTIYTFFACLAKDQ